jgi:hypothetical protein
MSTAHNIPQEINAPAAQEYTGARLLLELLKREKVDTIFGYPGGAIMPVYDALYDYRDDIQHILVRHEQGAAHAAEGYARASGRVGVCMATSGPGATNLVTGIADAMLDSVPIVCITGQVASSFLGTDAFQETDIIGITVPITKWNYKVDDDGITHIGPTAQDFYSTFGVGENAMTISTLDPASLALVGIQALGEKVDLERLREGTALTLKLLGDVMAKFGVASVDPQGQPFDPEYHQAMSVQPSNDLPPNTVTAVMQKGYTLNGRLVRPALVMVSKAA